jgi:hypothetical protein
MASLKNTFFDEQHSIPKDIPSEIHSNNQILHPDKSSPSSNTFNDNEYLLPPEQRNGSNSYINVTYSNAIENL